MTVNSRELLFEAKSKGIDKLVDAVLDEDSDEHKYFLKAKALQASDLKRTYLEACLLVSQDYPQIANILELDEALVYIYAKMLYDTEDCGILDKMELLTGKSEQEKLVKTWALNQGLNFIKWRLGNKVAMDPTDCLVELFSTAMYKAKEASFSGNETDNSKEALKWTKMSTDLARLIRMYSVDAESARNDIQIALEEVSQNFGSLADLNNDWVEPVVTEVEQTESGMDDSTFELSLDDLNKD